MVMTTSRMLHESLLSIIVSFDHKDGDITHMHNMSC